MRKNLYAGEGGSLYLLALCGISILSNIFYYALGTRAGTFAGISVSSWVNYAVIQVAIVLVVWIFTLWRKYDMPFVAKVKPMTNVGRYFMLIPIAILCMVAFFPVSILFQTILEAMGYSGGVSASGITYDNVGIFFLALFVIGLLPAIGEELLMRGNVLPAFMSRGTWFGVFISALLFSLLHTNPLQTAYQFCFGAVLAVVFLMSNSLWPCVILHFLNNAIILIVDAYIPEVNIIVANLGAYNWLTGIISFSVGIALLIVLLYIYYRIGQPKRDDSQFTVVENGIVFEDYSLHAYAETPAKKQPKNKFVAGLLAGFTMIGDGFKFFGSLFTGKGWKSAGRALEINSGIPYVGKAQPMFGVWLAIGLSAAYWLLAFIIGLV